MYIVYLHYITFIQNTTSGRSFTPVHYWDLLKLDKMMLWIRLLLEDRNKFKAEDFISSDLENYEDAWQKGRHMGPLETCKWMQIPNVTPACKLLWFVQGAIMSRADRFLQTSLGGCIIEALLEPKGVCVGSHFWTVNSLRKFPRFVIGLLTWWILTCNPTVISQLALHGRMKWL